MSDELPLRILFIDDDSGRLGGIRKLLAPTATVIVRDPFDVDSGDLADIDLVSVDENLGDDWFVATSDGGRFSVPASITNRDGLAVAAALRSQSRLGATQSRFAVTLHTAEIEKLSDGLPPSNRQALTAAQHDLEWVFEFNTDDFAARLIEIARAARSLIGHTDGLRGDFGAAWLQLPEEQWRDLAIEQITDCRPPANALALNTDGRSYLRWLAHRVLPYPTFLLDRFHAANLLGITPDSFDNIIAMLHSSEYTGPLAQFLGKRWWRAGLQTILVAAGVEQWDDPAERAAAISDALQSPVTALTSLQPVVTYSVHGAVDSIDGEASECVRLQRDGWPVYADDPWATIADVSDEPDLRRLVTQSERAKLTQVDA
jgi:hypothetical protein